MIGRHAMWAGDAPSPAGAGSKRRKADRMGNVQRAIGAYRTRQDQHLRVELLIEPAGDEAFEDMADRNGGKCERRDGCQRGNAQQPAEQGARPHPHASAASSR
jgi:hypothetical protein